MVKVFLKDILDRRTLMKYVVLAVVFSTLASSFVANNPAYQDIKFDFRMAVIIGLGLVLTIYYSITSYTTSENTGFYYQLPVDKNEVSAGFLQAFTVETLVSKILLIIAVIYYLNPPWVFYGTLVLLTPIATVLASVFSAYNIDSSKKIVSIIVSIIAIFAISYFVLDRELYLLSLIIFASYMAFVYKYYLDGLYFTASVISKKSRIKQTNYFLKFILAENVYLVNSLGLIAMIVVFSLAFPSSMSLPMTLAVGTVNTPLMTIFSTEKPVREYKSMLPSSYKSLDKDYLKVIGGYYILIHLLILALHYKTLNPMIILTVIIIVVIDTAVSFYLEKNHPITSKKTVNEVWKHPRKYILPIIIFLGSFVIFNILI